MAIIYFSIPFFLISVITEYLLARHWQTDWYENKDMLSSLAMGIGNVITGLLTKGIALGAMIWAYQYHWLTLPSTAWWVWVLAFFAEDLSYYLFHRYSHEIRYFWASHVVHHSSQKYNLSTALRQEWTGILSGSFVFWLWMPLVGFEPAMIIILQSISLLYQYWIHTEAIRKMPRWFEFLFNTPSHHRVHHASDTAYLDKNYAGILMIWDRLFGTFTPETVAPTYGLTKNIDTHNPLKIVSHEWIDIAKDVWHAPTLRDKIQYIIGAPGWRAQ
jgi:sterol desaturase/sphingolipid hydroxylase (fatty acid hydroxylase superfamily)